MLTAKCAVFGSKKSIFIKQQEPKGLLSNLSSKAPLIKISLLNDSTCCPFTNKKERIEKFMQTGKTDYIYKNDLEKACFQHDMAYGKFTDLAKRTQSDKFLRDKAFEIASNPKYNGY